MMPTSASFRLLIASTLLAGPAQAQYPRPPEDIRKKLAARSATVEANNETAWEKAKPEVLAWEAPFSPDP